MAIFFGARVGSARRFLVTIVAALAGRWLPRGNLQGLVLTRGQSALLGLPTIGVQLFAGWWLGLREPPPHLPDPADSRFFALTFIVPPGGFVSAEGSTEPLQVGDQFPTLEATGWLNGPPGDSADSAVGVTVIDVWNDLCPVCRYAAPGLLRIHEKYKSRNVRFVGLTSRERKDAEPFIEALDVDWPNGYGVDALSDAAPQIFVLDSQGRIVWYDERLRYRHEPKRLVRELDEAIQCSLMAETGDAMN